MTVRSPYKFLDSYTEEDRNIFFGRDQEIEEVYKKVFQGQTLFIYGDSGTGKSSLIKCGLANRFKKSDWLPVNVRRGNNINKSLLNELEKISLTKIDSLNGSFPRNLYKYTRSLYLDYFKPVYFIFDQFEELYLMGTREEWKEFVSGIKALTEYDLSVHFIFIIRAEYLHFLSEFEEELPEVFNNKIRVEKITRAKAKECIEGPCKIFNIDVDDDFADRLLDQLSPESIEIELTYLQVYLDRVYKLAAAKYQDANLKFSTELLEDIGLVSDVLADFLDEQIESMADKEATLTALKAFVTVDGTKRQASFDDILSFSKSLGKPIEKDKIEILIKGLLERRIIKELPDEHKFELRHDALADKIFEKITIRERELIEVKQFLEYGLSEFKKRNFLLNEKDLAYIEPHLPVLDLSGPIKEFVDESKKAAGKKRKIRNRVIGVITIIVILSITSIYGFFDAQKQRETALQQKMIAEDNAEVAEAQKKIAEQNASLALESQRLAEINAGEAERQAKIADQQRLIAELERNAADSSRIEAENQKLLALIQKDSAESARAQAMIYLEQANRERAKAEKLSMQTLARSLGIKSAQLPDVTLKSLLAMQAYHFNREFDGYDYQADIHNALYLAFKAYHGLDFNVLGGHSAAVNSIVKNKGNVYSAGSDGRILKWGSDLSSPQLWANTQEINYTLAVSSQGDYLAAGTANGNIFIYETGSQNLIKNFKAHEGRIWQIAFTNSGQIISSAEDLSVKMWDFNENESKLIIKFQSDPMAIAVCPEHDSLMVGLENGKIYSLSAVENADPRLVFESQNDRITILRFDNQGKFLAIGHESGSILMMNKHATGSANILTLPGHTAKVSDIKFSNEGKFMISAGYDRKNLLWNLENIKEPPISWADHESFVLATEFTPAGDEVLTGEINKTIRKYTLNMSYYANRMCQQVARNLTRSEWQNFVRDDVPYQNTCNELN